MEFWKIKALTLILCSCLVDMQGCHAALPQCTKVDDCSCKTSDGKTINIRSLGLQGPKPRFDFKSPESPEVWTYAYNPCYATFTDTDRCKNAVACQKSKDNPDEMYPIGDVTATWTSDDKNYIVEYSSTYGEKKRTSVVKLVCDIAANQPKLDRYGTHGAGGVKYDYTLTSKCACPGECDSSTPTVAPNTGISPGSVLCIIVSVLIVLYVVSGLLFMKFVRHAEGTDIIPNRDIWMGLFGNIRDGCVFVFTCGKSGYGTMK